MPAPTTHASPRGPVALVLTLLAVLLGGLTPAPAGAALTPTRYLELNTAINFGTVYSADTVTETLSFRNTSDRTVSVFRPAVFDPFGFSGPSSVTLVPGATGSFDATFTPTQTARFFAPSDLGVGPSDGSDIDSVPITLEGTRSVVPTVSLSVAPGTLDFGDVVVGDTSSSQAVTIENTGNVSIAFGNTAAAPFRPQYAGNTLNPGERTTVGVTFTPASRGTASGQLEIAYGQLGNPESRLSESISLTGKGIAPVLSASPTALHFGDVLAGTSPSQTVTLTNDGDAPLQLGTPTYRYSASIRAALDISTPLQPGGTRDMTVTYDSASAPDIDAYTEITVPSDSVGDPVVISADARKVVPSIKTLSVDKPTVNFGFQRPGPHPCDITVTNTGNATVFLSEVSVGDGAGPGPNTRLASDPIWSVEGSNAPLEAGETRTFTVYFDPAENIAYASTLTIGSDAEGAPLQIPLAGKGQVGKLTPSATSLAFGNVAAGAKLSKSITVKNTGSFAATFKLSISGAGAGKYTVSGSTASLAINEVRTLTVTFAPTARGAVDAALVLDGNAFNAPLSLPLSGKGIGPVATLSASSLAFGTVVRNKSLAKTITVSNTGESPLTFASAPKITGTDAARFTVSGATTALAAGASRVFTVTFKPTTKKGAHTASLTFATNSVPAPPAVALTGTGS